MTSKPETTERTVARMTAWWPGGPLRSGWHKWSIVLFWQQRLEYVQGVATIVEYAKHGR